MTNFFLSDNIEFNYAGQDVYNYALYLLSDLVNPIFSGKSYPFPQNQGTTKETTIQLNDIVENYVINDYALLIGESIHIQNPTNFRLVVTGFDNQDFNVAPRWLKLGDNKNNEQIMNNTYVRDNSYYNQIFVSYMPSTQPADITRVLLIKSYCKGVMTNYQTITTDVNKNDLVTLMIDPQAYLGTYPNLTDKIVFTDLVNVEDVGSFDSFTDTYSFNISACYPKHHIYYINRHGAIEMFGGTKSDKLNSTSTASYYKTDYRKWTGIDYVGNQANFATTRDMVVATDTYVIKTRILTDEEHNALEDLYSSPAVWVFDNDMYFSVIVTDTNYEEKKYASDRLVNRTISLKKSITNKRR